MYIPIAELYSNWMLLSFYWYPVRACKYIRYWSKITSWSSCPQNNALIFSIYCSSFMQNHNVFTYYLVEGLMKLLASGSMNLCQKWGKTQTEAKPQISPSAWSYTILGCDLAKEAEVHLYLESLQKSCCRRGWLFSYNFFLRWDHWDWHTLMLICLETFLSMKWALMARGDYHTQAAERKVLVEGTRQKKMRLTSLT